MTINISRALTIPGWMTEKELFWLAERASEHKMIVEVGACYGRTTCALADNTKGHVIVIDPFTDLYFDNNDMRYSPELPNSFDNFLNNTLNLNNIEMIVNWFSVDLLVNYPVDMIFVDADHRFPNVVFDVLTAKRIFAKYQGQKLLCGHDYGDPNWYEVKPAVDFALGHEPRTVEGTSIWYEYL